MNQPNDIPAVGDSIYIPTSLYVSRGADDFIGGLCTVTRIEGPILLTNGTQRYQVEVAEDPGTLYSWDHLRNEQDILRKQFGSRRGFKHPDHRDEFNRG